MSNKIDLNDYADYIDIDYLQSYKRMKEMQKSVDNYNNNNTDDSERYKNSLIELKEKLSKYSKKELQEYYEELEYIGIPKKYRHKPSVEELKRIKELKDLSNKSFMEDMKLYGSTTSPEYFKHLLELKIKNEQDLKINNEPRKMMIKTDDGLIDSDEWFKQKYNIDSTNTKSTLISIDKYFDNKKKGIPLLNHNVKIDIDL